MKEKTKKDYSIYNKKGGDDSDGWLKKKITLLFKLFFILFFIFIFKIFWSLLNYSTFYKYIYLLIVFLI